MTQIRSIFSSPICLRFILISSYHLRLQILSFVLTPGFSVQLFCTFLFPFACYTSRVCVILHMVKVSSETDKKIIIISGGGGGGGVGCVVVIKLAELG